MRVEQILNILLNISDAKEKERSFTAAVNVKVSFIILEYTF
jgi:hypothetical protein